MALREPDLFQMVKERVRLSDYFAGELRTKLRPVNGGYECLCPFHDEHTPSLRITEDHEGRAGRFKCFGCGASGSVVDAVMMLEQLEKPLEAVRWLDTHFKLELPLTSRANARAGRQHQRRVLASETAAKRGERALWEPSSPLAERGRNVLRDRGLSDETIKAFGLGVIADGKGGPRITIPIRDAHGQTLTITSRALFDSYACEHCGATTTAATIAKRTEAGTARRCPSCGQPTIPAFMARQVPKYLNAPGAEISKLLYNEAAAATRFLEKEVDEPLLVAEGYADVWAAHEAGHRAAVAYGGANISHVQAERLVALARQAQRGARRPHKYILLAPDFDDTGRQAVTRNLNILEQAAAKLEDEGQAATAAETAGGLAVRVLARLDGVGCSGSRCCKDLGELLHAHGPAVARRQLARHTVSPAEWRIRAMLDHERYTQDAQIHGVGQILGSTPHTLALSHLVPALAQHWDLAEQDVREFVHTAGSRGEASGRLREAKRLTRSMREVLADAALSDEQKLRGISRLAALLNDL